MLVYSFAFCYSFFNPCLIQRLREIYSVNGSGGADGFALTAEFAFAIIDGGQIVFKNYSIVLTGFETYRASYAGVGAGFFCNGAFVGVAASHKHAHSARTFVAKFYETLGAGLYTSAAGCAFFFINKRQTCYRVHAERTEEAGFHTIAAT
jgi:hypothetical protein